MLYLDKFFFLKRYNSGTVVTTPLVNFLSFLFELSLIAYLYTIVQQFSSGNSISFGESLYYTVITMSTVGFGEITPTTGLERIFTIVFMVAYLNLRFLYTLTQVVKLIKVKYDLSNLGRWFNMNSNHVILYCDVKTIRKNNFSFLEKFISQKKISNMYSDSKILVINNNPNENSALIDLFSERKSDFPGVSFNNIRLNERDFFKKINIAEARRVYVLADEHDDRSDSDVFDFVYRVDKETDYNNGITAEVVNDDNRERIRKHGADVILRPNRSMPELLITATIAPGSGEMIEEIISRGNSSLERFNLELSDNFIWGELSHGLMMSEVGTLDAVIYPKGNNEITKANPKGKTVISGASGIIIQIHNMKSKSYSEIQSKINSIIRTVEHQGVTEGALTL